MIVRMLAVSVLALAAGAMAESARASQFFVCEDGRTIEVARGQLEAAKRDNACVAKHFGLTVEKAPSAPRKVSAKPDRVQPAAAPRDIAVVLPVRKPKRAALRASAPTAPPQRDRLSSQRIAGAASVSYRRVRVINAQTPSGRWFLHTR